MRAFLVLPAEESLQRELQSCSDPLREIKGVKPVVPENYHLTVKFLGDCSVETANDLDRLFQRQLPIPGPFSLEVKGAGAFPNLESPSVLWAGVESDPALLEFVDSVESITESLGFQPESRDYHPHITLGRVKQSSPQQSETIVEWVQSVDSDPLGNLTADHLILYESETGPDGPTYHERERWPL